MTIDDFLNGMVITTLLATPPLMLGGFGFANGGAYGGADCGWLSTPRV